MQKDSKETFGEGLNLAGKLFLGALGAWAVGKVVNTKLRGSKSDMEVISNALWSSRKFQDEMHKPGANFNSVMEKLHVKNMSASEFERTFGIPWPL